MPLRHLTAVVAGAVAAMLLGALVVVVARAESPPTAREALAMAKRFVEQAESVEYRGASRVEYHDPEFPEDDFTDESTFEEAAQFPDEARAVLEYAEFATESIVIDDVTYIREAEDREELQEELWARYEDFDDEFAPVVGGGFLVPASDLPELVAASSRPRLLGQNGGQSVVRVRVDTAEFEEVYIPSVRLDLVIEPSGRVRAMRLRAGDEYETQHAQVEIERWNGDAGIAAPDAADVDPTPSVDEEDIAAFGDTALFQPRVLPADFALQAAYVIPEGDFGVEGEEVPCDQVNLYFASQTLFEFDEFDEDTIPTSTYLDLFEYPTSCSKERPDDAEDFAAGPYAGWFEEEDGYLSGQLAVGDTVVEFTSDLDGATLTATLADLVPLDLSALPTASAA